MVHSNTLRDKLSRWFITGLLTAAALLCLFPILNLIAISFSDKASTSANEVIFWPLGFNTNAYEIILKNHAFLHSLWIAVERVVAGVAVNMCLILLSAYPLAQEVKRFKSRTFFVWYYVFTILFSGGLVPLFIVVNKMNLYNNFWALILPYAVPAFSVIILMNFFRSLPAGLTEAAVMDGAGHWTILLRICLPLSLPALATLALFSFVQHWNDWFVGLYLMSDSVKWPLQTYLYSQLYVGIDFSRLSPDEAILIGSISDRSLRAAQILLTMVPILIVYPFIQRFFVAGLTIGSVKE
ncbi:carbohydrate ABC transporter permease [Cohnella faecalis]|uniref:Carbohydrate ABC transporter permease n=1 Tax=Cohnella faecalis TaxID=2315694 RepID=A0A398CGL7_9BACL|nr:carbohydrate ABC transporter permease [Cohnella faecalis]RIE01883.1 carbohydrate ABC transporter permease [Cohnella faecalis]